MGYKRQELVLREQLNGKIDQIEILEASNQKHVAEKSKLQESALKDKEQVMVLQNEVASLKLQLKEMEFKV